MNDDIEDVIMQLRSVQNGYAAKRAALKAELDKIDLEYKRADRALRLLTGEPTSGPRPKPTPQKQYPKGIDDARLEEIRAAVLKYAEDHEEFRQVDIRTMAGLDPAIAKSSTMAIAFDKLRQDNTIRLARVEGNNKWFRLTREAMNGHG